MSYIYLASPYAHPEAAVMHSRYIAARDAVAEMLSHGEIVYSPIVHNHDLACNYDLPRTWDFWKHIDLAMLRHASTLHVLMLPGWEESTGVTAEIAAAQAVGLPVHYID